MAVKRGALHPWMVGGLLLALAVPLPALATHVLPPFAVELVRTPMPGEGYLQYGVNPCAGQPGEEWTGWMDLRHPALLGSRGFTFGYDRSDRSLAVQTTTLIDENGVSALPDIARDFDFANRAFVGQAGLTLLEVAHRDHASPPLGQASSFAFPLTAADETALAAGLNAGAPTVDVYYTRSLMTPAALAETLVPGAVPAPAVFVADLNSTGFPTQNDTFSHELAHFATAGRAVHMEDPSDVPHSMDPNNLLAGAGRNRPGSLLDIGPAGLDQITPSQVERIFSSAASGNAAEPYVQTLAPHPPAAGDRVDWDFVVDHPSLETIANRADNHPGPDFLYWEIGFTTPADHVLHDHADWDPSLAAGDFLGPSFRFVDVFSIDARYSDAGEFGPSAIFDYAVFFRATDGTIAPGVPVLMFEDGWTFSSFADGVVRWQSPFDAVGVFVSALGPADGHDGVTQIDGIIAFVPEPSVATLVLLAAPLLLRALRRRPTRQART